VSIGRPAAALTLTGAAAPGRALGLAEAAVRRLRVDLSVDEAHDRIELDVWAGSKLAGAAPGDALGVALGDGAGDPEDVLAGEVAGIEAAPGGAVLTAYAQSRKLSLSHAGRSWRQAGLDQVVRDLLGDGNAGAGDIIATLQLPALHVDPRRSIWSALHDLARRSGHQITSTADGSVSFTPAPGPPRSPSELREGAELLSYQAGPHGTRTTLTRVTPAASRYWYQLEASPDGGSDVEIVDPALRTREAADAATSAASAAASRAGRRARIRVPGRPGLRAGATIRARGEGFRVLRVRHLVDPHSGYVCDLLLEGDS